MPPRTLTNKQCEKKKEDFFQETPKRNDNSAAKTVDTSRDDSAAR